jgi:hypothetical protein
MVDPSKMTLGELASTLRDFFLLVTLIVAIWKASGAVRLAVDFFKDAKAVMSRALNHMDKMEEGMDSLEDGVQLLLTNHLPHLHAELIEYNKSHALHNAVADPEIIPEKTLEL